jgi:hypothetical protein
MQTELEENFAVTRFPFQVAWPYFLNSSDPFLMTDARTSTALFVVCSLQDEVRTTPE